MDKTKLLAQKIGEGVLPGAAAGDANILGVILSNLIIYASIIGGFFLLYQLVMGALDWIQSEGEAEKVAKARKRLTGALVGFMVLMVVWALFFFLLRDILGIFGGSGNALEIQLPSLFGN